MITIQGNVLDVTVIQKTNYSTGEINPEYTAEILHKVKGRSEVEHLKLDRKVYDQWRSAIGKNIIAEIRFYAMKGQDGTVMSGIILADKMSLPVLANVTQSIKQAA